MQLQAIETSKDKLRKAKNALADYNAAKSFDQALDAWTTFLNAVGGVYAKLEQGCKGNKNSEAWFNRKHQERKTDKMLQYLHQARNADEHGLARVARNDLATGINKTLAFNERIPVKVQFLEADRKTPKGEPRDAVVAGPSARLVAVTNRGQTYAPPSEHLGEPLPYGEDFHDVVMGAAIEYIETMIAEAEALVV